MSDLANIEHLEASLWDAADNLRANSKLTAGEYCMPVLGVRVRGGEEKFSGEDQRLKRIAE